MSLWDRIIPQAVISLNLLRSSRINPKLSAYAQVFGQFSYNATPLAPPGTHVLVHDKPAHRDSWAPHAIDAWYLGPALNHYRCYRVYAWDTKRERHADTVTWLPKLVTLPQLTPSETILQCTEQLTKALLQLNTVSPSESLASNQNLQTALSQFNEILITVPTTSTADQRVESESTQESVLTQDTQELIETIRNHKPNPPAFQRVEITEPTAIPANNETSEPTYLQDESNKMGLKPIRQSERGRIPSTKYKYDYASSAINVDTGKLAEYRQLIKSSQGHLWLRGSCEEWARLAQGLPTEGIPESAGTNTIRFIHFSELPPDCHPTYPRFVCADRPNKPNPIRVRITVGGDQIDYPEDVSTKVSDMSTVKVLINSTISTDDAKFMSADVTDFYLNTIMERKEYMRVPIALFPEAIINYYKLHEKLHNGFIYVEISKGMYGLPQAGKLANDELVEHLAESGYHQSKFTSGLFTHETRPVSFCLVVDDFGIKYQGKEHAEHLLQTLQKKYVITTDWAGTKYIGLDIKWDYINRTVDISMPKYIPKALQRFEHEKPKKPQHSPHAWLKPNYGAKQQMTQDPDLGTPLLPQETKKLQQIIGVLLYYSRAVDSTMLVALGSLAAAQTKATTTTMKEASQLLDYVATHPNATVRFVKSQMILKIHSDASYLSETEARSRAGGLFFLGDDDTNQHINGAIHVHSSIMKHVQSSAAEAECGALFQNAQEACTIRQALCDLGHAQPATPIQTDNACANGIMNSTVKQKRSKAIDMRYYWLRDRVHQKQFRVYWEPGSDNRADYFTKHHPPAHHIEIRSTYLHEDKSIQSQ